MNRDVAAGIRLMALDVDGVLTDGQIVYSSAGEELKAFNIRDGLGIKLLQRAGVEVAIITGRNSPMVARRAGELGIERIVQGREDKRVALEELCGEMDIAVTECAYMGDDLPDLGAVRSAGLGLTVCNAGSALQEAADWCSTLPGGAGAVREASEALLRARDQWDTIVAEFR